MGRQSSQRYTSELAEAIAHSQHDPRPSHHGTPARLVRRARPKPAWRAAPEPYATRLSEVILQQTRVDTGTAYWHRFLAAFPTVQDLAAAPPEAVMALWKGLGYYSRARNLHAAARQIVTSGQGAMPTDAEGWRQLPGVGPYTAAAISSICFSEPVPVVDGNVQRVLSRLFDVADPVDRKAGKSAIEAAAASLVHPTRPGDSNQAWMELGALICKPKTPDCASAPSNRSVPPASPAPTSNVPSNSPKSPLWKCRWCSMCWRSRPGHDLEWWVERRPERGIWGGLEAFRSRWRRPDKPRIAGFVGAHPPHPHPPEDDGLVFGVRSRGRGCSRSWRVGGGDRCRPDLALG